MKIEAADTDNNFTVLRLTLALLVVLGHFQAFYGVKHPEWPFVYAAAAVDCFFVVSGYLVANSFDRDSDLGRFYIRRLFRIYPLYIIVVMLQTLILGNLAPGGFFGNLPEIARYFAANAVFANFIQHDIGGVLEGMADPSLNASLWTLKIEFGFYLILPFIWMGVRRFGLPLLIGIFIASAIYQETLKHYGEYELAKQLPGQLQYFVLGIGAYRYREVWQKYLTNGSALALGLTIVLAAGLTLLLKPHPAVIYPLVVGIFVIIATFKAPIIPMRTDISFGVYLVHAPIIQLSLMFGLYRHDWYGLAATIATAIVLSLIAERLVERPGIAIGKRISKQIAWKRRSPATA